MYLSKTGTQKKEKYPNSWFHVYQVPRATLWFSDWLWGLRIQHVVTCTAMMYSQSGTLIETQCPEFLLGAGHTGSLCLVYAQILVSQKESSYSAKSYSLYSLGIVVTLTILEWWEPSQNPSSQMSANSQTCKQAFKRIAGRFGMITLFCTPLSQRRYYKGN